MIKFFDSASFKVKYDANLWGAIHCARLGWDGFPFRGRNNIAPPKLACDLEAVENLILCNIFLSRIEYTNRDTKKRLNGGIRNFVNEPR